MFKNWSEYADSLLFIGAVKEEKIKKIEQKTRFYFADFLLCADSENLELPYSVTAKNYLFKLYELLIKNYVHYWDERAEKFNIRFGYVVNEFLKAASGQDRFKVRNVFISLTTQKLNKSKNKIKQGRKRITNLNKNTILFIKQAQKKD